MLGRVFVQGIREFETIFYYLMEDCLMDNDVLR